VVLRHLSENQSQSSRSSIFFGTVTASARFLASSLNLVLIEHNDKIAKTSTKNLIIWNFADFRNAA
jgi:hypothetical protein